MRIDDLGKTYRLCKKTGSIREKHTDIGLIRSLNNVARNGLRFIERISRDIPKDSDEWTFVFREYYESLRGLIEAVMLFDGLKAENHQCKNAYVCSRYAELGLKWEFLEEVRLKRNAINYRGYSMKYSDWEYFMPGFQLHISLLCTKIDDLMSGPP